MRLHPSPRPPRTAFVLVFLATVVTACSGGEGTKTAATGGTAGTGGIATITGGAPGIASGGTGGPSGGASAGTGGAPSGTGRADPDASVSVDGGTEEGGTPPDAGPDATTPDAGSPPALDVRIASGALRGKVQYGVREFLGIPFGKPPVGPLRFAPPLSAGPWAGTRDATAYRPSCLQPRDTVEGPMDEDCLFLNVFTPLNPPQGGAPVMVFIHGGGFGVGGGSGYPSEWLVGRKNVVVVTLNYRLGRFGFLATPDLDAALGTPSGNLGLKDQQLALRWVKENIDAFGGDATNVTVFGESAGGMSACYHLFLKGSEGLMNRIVMESGSCFVGAGAPRRRQEVLDASTSIVNQVCPFAPDPVACLRSLPASALVPAGLVSATMLVDAASGPHIDGALLPDAPRALLARGEFARVPFIGGSNLHEAVYFQLFGVPKPANALEFVLALGLLYPDASHAPRLASHYMPGPGEDANAAFVRAVTDDVGRCPARHMARSFAAQGVANYLYSFDIPPGGHAQELDYVFGWPGGSLSKAYPGVAPLPPLTDIVDATQTYWTQFARSSSPNNGVLLEWPRYTRDSDAHLVIGTTLAVGHGLARDDCDWWDSEMAQ
jgi:para-nitrobenzyl esterase